MAAARNSQRCHRAAGEAGRVAEAAQLTSAPSGASKIFTLENRSPVRLRPRQWLDVLRETFSRAVGFAKDLGLLAEEVDPKTRELLGNFPQAFSHIGLVNAAWAISEAERRVRELSVAERPSLPKSA
jgi:hypothetical protein